MNIIIIGTAYPLRGGIAHYNALLAKELSRHHSVETITFKRQYPNILFPGKTQEETGEASGATPAPQLIDSINPLNWIVVGREIKKRKPDLLIFKYWLPFFGPCFGTIARIATRKTKTKVLFICDNVIPHEKRPGDRLFTRYAFKAGDFFIAQSEAVERDLLKFWPEAKHRKVPHPVYNIFGEIVEKKVARKTLDISAEKVLLFFGYIRGYKGLNILIDALPRVLKQMNVHLFVVGEFYDNEEKYRKQIAELGVGENITVKSDYVPNEDVAKYFSAADVVILPYLSATQSGIAQIAYNFHKPVIATDVGGLGEVVLDQKTGFLVPPGDAEALAASIIRFYAENRERDFEANVEKEKLKYSWEAMTSAIEEMTS